MCIYNALKAQRNMAECCGRRGGWVDGKRKIIWWKFRCKHTKEFQSESLQKLCTKSESKPERVAMCVWHGVCLCVRVYIAEKKVRSARGHQRSLARWHGRRRRKQGRTAVIICIVVACATFFFRRLAWLQLRRAIGPTRPAPSPIPVAIETINKSKVRLRRVFSKLVQEQEEKKTTTTTTTLWQCCQCLRSHALCCCLLLRLASFTFASVQFLSYTYLHCHSAIASPSLLCVRSLLSCLSLFSEATIL